jgi:hypothetical protein
MNVVNILPCDKLSTLCHPQQLLSSKTTEDTLSHSNFIPSTTYANYNDLISVFQIGKYLKNVPNNETKVNDV